MGFLIKAAFWLSVVVVLLPAPESNEGSTRLIGTTEAVSLLSAALNDARGFCQRNPEACVTGTQAAQSFGQKAQYASRLLHDFISDRVDNGVTSASTPSPHSKGRVPAGSIDTLSPADLEPAWRSPDIRQASLKRS